MEAIKALKERRSIRTFEERPIPKEVLEDIVDCGRLAATANNAQPWEFVVVTDPQTRAQIARLAEYGGFIAQAPACIAVFCRKRSRYFLEDGSAATQNILVAARAHGVGSCWVAGYGKGYAKEVERVLNVPDDYVLVSLIALGYSDSEPSPRKRALEDVIHWERF